ncbi:MAG TPA: HlyD family type I secretion periplasmic adaptor subunit [Rhizomicrobium sp.]|nr:HlyD family type I secretion periplasmic adaptor subunit [Rhizomicrobium sp.]
MSDQAQAAPPPAPRFTPPRIVLNLWNSRWVVRARKFVFPEDEQTYSDPRFDYLGPDKIIRTGMIVVGVFFIGILGWGSLAPLDSAIVAQGVVVVETHRKTIQHLEGGIVQSVYVRDGQLVHSGQPLVQLDDTESRASMDLIRGEADALAAQEARLEAERDGADKIAFPTDLLARKSDPKVAEALRGEQNTFDTHRATLAKQQEIFNQRINENHRIVAGLQSQQTSVDQQSQLIGQESDSVQQLYSKGLSTLPRLLQLKREAADLTGQHGQVAEKMAQVNLDSGEDELQIVNLRNQFMNDVVKDLRDVQTKRFEALDRLHAAKDIVARLRMSAPTDGRVVALAVHSRGAVLRPGDTVMEIVPIEDQLDVEARVRPEDADDVHVGMTAKVNLGAYNQRRLPMITGTVKTVSADRLVDAHTNQPYFSVMIGVDRSQLKDYPDVKLIPGMPVDVSLNTGARTAVEYFLEPITGIFRHGMRER